MGFDNECILNIQSLPGEYFCPVCRTLVYPNEALQSQCTHLYCKPCLAYVVATTRACPYDGYLVTEADSKPLAESSKPLADAISKLAVYCLYHRSGCQWQGTLTECITHCATCSYGDSPVVCNRCGTQIVHRQVQEHAQTCPGLQPQTQQAEIGSSQAATASSQVVAQDSTAAMSTAAAPAATIAAASTATAVTGVALTSAPAKSASAAVPASVPPAAASQSQAQPVAQTPEQWYQQQQQLQYQQYYQQYPGYDPYQQQYQQHAQYQQQAYAQFAQSQTQVVSQQPSQYAQVQQPLQPQNQKPLQPQQQAQPQMPQYAPSQAAQQPAPQHLPPPPPHPHLQPQPQASNQGIQMQAPRLPAPAQQTNPQVHPQTVPVAQTQATGQQFVQTSAQPQQLHNQVQAQPQFQSPPVQQAMQSQQHPMSKLPNQPSVPQQQPHLQQPQTGSQHQVQQHLQMQPHPQVQLQQPQPNLQLQHQYPAHSVTGHQSFPHPPPGGPPQRPMSMHSHQQGVPQHPHHPVQVQSQVPNQQPQLHPPHGQMPVQAQQQKPMLPPQGPHGPHPAPLHQHSAHQGQQLYQHPGTQSQGSQPSHHGFFPPGHPHPQGPPTQQQIHPQGPVHIHPHQYQQQNLPQGQALPIHQSQNVANRPMMANHAIPHQEPKQAAGVPSNLLQPSPNQRGAGQNNLSRFTSGSQGMAPMSNIPLSGLDDQAGHASELEPKSLTEKGSNSQKDSVNTRDANYEINVEKSMLELKKEEHDSSSAKINGEVLESHVKHERMEGQDSKQNFKEKMTEMEDEKSEPSDAHRNVLGDGEIQTGEGGRNKPVDQVEEKSSHGDSSGGIQQPSHQEVPPYERAPMHPAFQERNAPHDTGKERYAHQQITHGHPSHFPGASQSHPAPDQLFPQQIDRRFHDPPHQMISHGQARGAGAAMRPPGPSLLEPYGQPPRPNFPPGPFATEGSNSVFPQPGMSLANRPSTHGPRTNSGEALTRPPGPPHGTFDSPIRPMPRVPFGPQDQIGPSRGHGYFDGKQPDPRAAQLSMMAANGIPGKDQHGGMHDPALPHGTEDHFRRLPEDDLRMPFPVDSTRHTGFRSEFEEDLKQFPRPPHFDGEGAPKYDSYFSSSRHGDKRMPPFGETLPRFFDGGFPGPDGGPPFPPRKIDPFAAGSANADRHMMDRLKRNRPLGFSEEFPANHDPLRRPPEFGNHHIDALPPIGSPGGFGYSNRSRMDDFDPLEPLGGSTFLPHPMGSVKLPGNARSSFGRNHPLSDFAEPGHFSAGPYNGEMDPFDSKWRKVATRCLLCKIDCESLEALEIHSQTREHQKTAMDIIMNIKHETSKKQRISKDNVSLKESNKFRKTGFEKRGNRH